MENAKDVEFRNRLFRQLADLTVRVNAAQEKGETDLVESFLFEYDLLLGKLVLVCGEGSGLLPVQASLRMLGRQYQKQNNHTRLLNFIADSVHQCNVILDVDSHHDSVVSEAKPQSSSISQFSIPHENVQSFLSISESIGRYVEQNQQLFEQMLSVAALYASVGDISKVVNAQIALAELGKIAESPAFKLATTANLSIGRLVDQIDASWLAGLQNDVDSLSAFKSNIPNMKQVVDAFGGHQVVLQSHLANISKISLLAEASLSRWGGQVQTDT